MIGAGGSPFGLGSDLAGSIRVPAFCCGIFGHKPSTGVVPTTGHFPMDGGPSRRMLVFGPLARRAEDLLPLMEILNIDDPDDPFDREIPLGDPAEVQLKGLRVVMPVGAGITWGVSREMLAVRERAAAHLAAQGADIVRVKTGPLLRAQLIFIEALRSSWNDEFVDSIGWEAQRVRDLYRGLRKGRGDHTVAFVNLAASVSLLGRVYAPRPAGKFVDAIDRLAAKVAAQIGDGVMLLPSLPRPAPPHGWTTLRPWAMGTMVPANLFGWPATQIPMGIGREGLPLGLQAVAPMDQDHRTIAIALELERAFGGWVPPEEAPAPPGGAGTRERTRARPHPGRACAWPPRRSGVGASSQHATARRNVRSSPWCVCCSFAWATSAVRPVPRPCSVPRWLSAACLATLRSTVLAPAAGMWGMLPIAGPSLRVSAAAIRCRGGHGRSRPPICASSIS